MKKILQGIAVVIGLIIVCAYIYFEGQSMVGGIVGIFSKKPWSGSYYASATSGFAETEKFNSSEECIKWATEQAKSDGKKEGEWRYTCGLNCKYAGRKPGSTVDSYECEQILPEEEL